MKATGKVKTGYKDKDMLACAYSGMKPLLRKKMIEKVMLGDRDPIFRVTEEYKNKKAG